MDLRWAEVGFARRRTGFHLVANSLELAAADVGEVFARGGRRGALVQEHWNLELAADAFAERAREDDAVLHRRSLERDEGNDVGRAHARMFARVMIEIDLLASDAHAC